MKASENGDYETAFKTQSYFAPGFAYEYNPMHGVTFKKSVNGYVVQPVYPFVYQDMAHLKVRKLL